MCTPTTHHLRIIRPTTLTATTTPTPTTSTTNTTNTTHTTNTTPNTNTTPLHPTPYTTTRTATTDITRKVDRTIASGSLWCGRVVSVRVVACRCANPHTAGARIRALLEQVTYVRITYRHIPICRYVPGLSIFLYR